MKVLTIKEPYATLIIEGHKKYEFRSWKTNYRGKILIHAGMSLEHDVLDRFKDYNLNYSKGAIIGEAELIDCILVDEDLNKKLQAINPIVYGKSNHQETYAWKLTNIIKYDQPIPIKGKLGLWNYEPEVNVLDIYKKITNDKNIINIYKEIEKYENETKGWAHHNIEHIKNVTQITEKILTMLNYSPEFITKGKIACYLHDVGASEGKEEHALRSYQFAKQYFNKNNIYFENIDLVLDAIKNHSDGFDTDNIIALSLILADKLDIKKTRVAEEGKKVIGMRQLLYVEDILIKIENKILTVNFIVDDNLNLQELNEFYFTKKVFKAIESFSNKLKINYQILLNNKEWILENQINYKIIKELCPEDLIELRKEIGWKDINYEQIKKGLDNTMCKVSIKIDNQIIACGRLVGDYSCKGILSDIIVHPEYQGKGYGKIIVTTLIEMTNNNLKEGELFQIEATPTAGNKDFYLKCGMKYKPENQDGVYLWLKK